MNLEEFLAAVEEAPSEPLEPAERVALKRMLKSQLFLRACKPFAEQAVNATGAFTKLDLNTPEGVARGKDLQSAVKSTFYVLESLISQTEEEEDDRDRDSHA